MSGNLCAQRQTFNITVLALLKFKSRVQNLRKSEVCDQTLKVIFFIFRRLLNDVFLGFELTYHLKHIMLCWCYDLLSSLISRILVQCRACRLVVGRFRVRILTQLSAILTGMSNDFAQSLQENFRKIRTLN